jgi:hypothetical protein
MRLDYCKNRAAAVEERGYALSWVREGFHGKNCFFDYKRDGVEQKNDYEQTKDSCGAKR